MFCSYCGKPISDSARFCSFCGKEVVKVQSAVSLAGSEHAEEESPLNSGTSVLSEEPVSERITDIEEQTVSVENTSELVEQAVGRQAAQQEPAEQTAVSESTVPDFTQHTDVIQPTRVSESAAPDFTQRTDVIQPTRVSESTAPDFKQRNDSVRQVQISEQQTSPERKYTLTHLLMCLASTAVFAIAAGIFAGLYFSGL